MSRVNYWSCSKFAAWIRKKFGLQVLKCATFEEWEEYKKSSKEKSPFIHWFTDTCLNKIQNFFCWPKDRLWDIRCALKSKFGDKYHYLPTRLDPWRYHEVDTRMLHGLFETLVDFIEIEKAWMNVIFGDEENYKKFGYTKREMCSWLNWIGSERRHPASGLAHLEWEMNLKFDDEYMQNYQPSIEKAKQEGYYNQPTPQAKAAKEQFELYDWWKNVRPNRQDPWEASGYSAYYAAKGESTDDFLSSLGSKNNENEAEAKKCMDLLNEIEAAYEKEDEEMLIRLIKIRKSLWT